MENKSENKAKENKKPKDVIESTNSIDLTKYPITTNTFTLTPMAIFIFLLLNILSLMIPAAMIITYFVSALHKNVFHWRLFFIFIDIIGWWTCFLLLSLLFGKLFLILLSLIHKPKEGLFKIDKNDKDYYFYCLRTAVKKYIFWVYNNFCFPWATNLAFKVCNMKADFRSTLFDGWSDLEFIEYGNNVMLGQGAVVLSSMIIGDQLLIKKVIIGDHVVLGGNAVVAPGTIIGANTTLGIWATTHIGQILEPGWIYIGRPARKYKPAEKMKEDKKKQILRRIVDTGEREPFPTETYVKKDIDTIIKKKLDAKYNDWISSEEIKNIKDLKKKYKEEKKKIKREIKDN